MKIYYDNTLLDIEVNDNSYRNRVVKGENKLTLYFSLPQHIELPVGAYCVFENETYTLMQPEGFKMLHARNFEYTLLLDSAQANLAKYKLRDRSHWLKFNLTAKPKDHLKLLVDNMNERESGWTAGECCDAVEKTIAYNHTSCDAALSQMADAFETEWEVAGKTISLHKVEYNKTNPLPLNHGRGKGFKPGTGRTTASDSKPTEILYVQGGERNIDPSSYDLATHSRYLLLPKKKTLKYDGTYFEDQAGFDATKSRSYISSDDGLSIRRLDKSWNTNAEDSLDLPDIYPSRVGKISKVEVTQKGFCDFFDTTIPETLDYSKYRIEGEKMTVIFQSGMLSGKEFDIQQEDKTISGYVHKERRFKIVEQQIDGEPMPKGNYMPMVGDTYAVFGIMLPQDYICGVTTKTGASWDMYREGVKHLYENEEPKFTFTGELDGAWAKKDWLNIGGKIKLGGYILFSDPQYQPEGIEIRIVGIKDYVNNPHSPEIQLSNSIVGSSIMSDLRQIESNEVAADNLHKKAIQYTKRRFSDAQETVAMLEKAMLNFTTSVNPVSVKTMQVLIGDESLQYCFVNNISDHVIVSHTVTYNEQTRILTAPRGTMQHLTVGVKTLSSRKASDYKYWVVSAYASPTLTEPAQSYYLYIKASRTTSTAEFVLSETAITMEGVTGFYHFLYGILNSESEGERSFVSMYGFSELTPGRLVIDLITGGPGGEMEIDLKRGTVKGNITFTSGSSGLNNLSEWQGKQNEIDNAQQTANDAKAAAAAAANTATQTNTAVVDLTSYIDGAFADGIIETSEANAIATYINNINEAKATADSSYTTVYANPLLSGGAKTNLSTAKSNLDTARTALLSSINTAIADRKTTVAEKADVDAKFASYNAAYGVFTTRLQDAGKSIENIINQTATDAALAAKNSQQTADEANALLADIASDNRLIPSEKSTTKKEWETIVLEKPTIIAQADIYHISTADYTSAYNALNSYLTSLLSDLTTTSDIVGVTFRERFTTYYTYRTGLMTAVAEAAKGYVDNIEIGGRNLLRNSALTTLNGNTSYAAGWIVKLKKGQKYTLSYDSTTIVEQQGYPQFYIWSRVWEDPTKPIMFLGSVVESKSRSFTCTLNDGEYFLDVFVHIYPMPDKQIIKIQLEEGDKATTWREAPEDTAYTIAGRNYLMNSRYDKVGMFDLHGGVTKRVSDPELGDVVEYSRPINVGEFMTNHKFTNLPNQDVVYYVVAKLISGTGDFAFGGWSETTTGVSASCEYINLGNGWRQYYHTFKSGANLASGGTFGINSVAGTWQFYAAGILKGKDVTVWAASPEDIKARVDNFEYLKETFKDSHTEVTGGAMLTSFIGVRDGEVVRAGMTSGEHGLPFFFADADGAKNAASAGFTVSREAFVRSGGADGSIFLENGKMSLCSMVADGAGNRGDSEQVYLTGREFDTDANNPFVGAINAHKRATKSYTIHKQVVCDVTITEQDLNPQTHLAETNILTKVLNSFYCGKKSAGITNSVEINSVTLTITKTGRGAPSVAIGWAMCNPWYCPFAYDSAGHIAESNWVTCPTGTGLLSYTLPFRGFRSSFDFIYHIASSIAIKDAAAGDHIIVALNADPVVTVQYNPSINALHYGNGSVAFQDSTHYAGIASDGVNSLVAQRNGNQGFKADNKGQACWSTDRNGWDYSRLLLTGRIAANGLISYQSGVFSCTVRRADTGVYIVTHDKGDQNYTVSVTPWSDSDSRIVCNVGAISNNSFSVHMIGSQGGIYDCGFMLQMFGY